MERQPIYDLDNDSLGRIDLCETVDRMFEESDKKVIEILSKYLRSEDDRPTPPTV